MITHAVRIFDDTHTIVWSAGYAGLRDARNALVSRGYVFRYRRSNRGWTQWTYVKEAIQLGHLTIPAERGVIEEL